MILKGKRREKMSLHITPVKTENASMKDDVSTAKVHFTHQKDNVVVSISICRWFVMSWRRP
jgi:hypothetical protein